MVEGLEQKKKKKSAVKEVVSWLVYLIIFAAVAFFLIHYVGERTVVSGDSMLPTLQNGDNLIVDKLSYRFRDPKRFEIVVFPFRYQEDTYYIKRIIGLPGETIQIKDGMIYIDGEVYLEKKSYPVITNPGMVSDGITLGNQEYFVLGDNRNNSVDSRFADVGTVKASYIEGKVWFVLSPSEHRGLVK